jgi:VIT1/CCC1 family predicted Fe2+/Mn2+ transporter
MKNFSIKHFLTTGISFGLTSAVITTLGLMVGLNSSTRSKLAVIGGILIIAIADAFSDAFGIHISEESENNHKEKEVWLVTICTFLAKFLFAITFIFPVLVFSLKKAVIINIIWGLFLISILSFYLATTQKKKPFKVIFEHLIIAIIVIFLSNYIGRLISYFFS